MALLITDACINCDMCEPECPNNAISEGKKVYTIEPDLCTECIGFYDEPTCISVCPINCIIIHPSHIETSEQLLHKFNQMYQ